MQKQRLSYAAVVAVILLFIVYGISYHHKRIVDTIDDSRTTVNGDFTSLFPSARVPTSPIPPLKVQTSPIPPLEDFQRYPCLRKDSNLSSSEIPGGCVRTVSIPAREEPSSDTGCVILKQANTDICTYDPSQDLISEYLHESGEWEPDLVRNFIETLQANPGYVFLDIGCNIGVYTIAAAATKIKTICVDANQENLNLVAKSLSRGRLEDYVTIVWNALSNRRGLMDFHIVKGNSGASRIDDITKLKHLTKLRDVSVNAILLDDITWLVRGQKLFVKLDAERHELFVLEGGRNLFKNSDVRVVQMEIYEGDTLETLVNMLSEWGFTMYRDPAGTKRLDTSEFKTNWPGDVYFIKA